MNMSSDLVSEFEERAENLSENELKTWTVLSAAERQIVEKLIGPGAKLISGPRGSGKSTLLKVAFFQLHRSKAALPVYVNFSKALALEPLFHTHADATRWFRQWVLAKIISGIKETCVTWPISLTAGASLTTESAAMFINELETGQPPHQLLELSPSGVSEFIREISALCGVNRAVLLLDDAAHAFSVKQQREFFEVFRELRSREIAAKAAIYPGVTSFSPSFQVGHEAEEIQAWIRADSDAYLNTMREIAVKRFPLLRQRLGTSYDEAVDVLALASFGLPRGFVNMISELIDLVELQSPVRPAVIEAIASNSDAVMGLFENIADKLPRFANYIEVGRTLEAKVRASFRSFNRGKSSRAKTATIGLAEPWPPELDRVLHFMEYAGTLHRVEDLSKGVKGNYQRYMLHYSRVISMNALFLGKNYKLADIVASLKRPTAHALVKTKPDTLLARSPTCLRSRLG
jgi:hypothetical protein